MKEKFEIVEMNHGAELYVTPCYAKNEKTVLRTSIYKNCLINKSFESVIFIRKCKNK